MTPGPIAAAFVANFIGFVAFPILWAVLARWQKRRGLVKLAVFSFLATLLPVAVLGLLYVSDVPKIAVMSFIFFVPTNVLLILVSFSASRVLLRMQPNSALKATP